MTLDSLFDAAGTGNRPSGRMRAVEITQAHDIRIVETAIPEHRTRRRADQADGMRHLRNGSAHPEARLSGHRLSCHAGP